MEINASCVLEIWDFFSEYVPTGKRNEAAIKYLKLFLDQDVESEEFDEIRGEDVHLDNALDSLTGGSHDLDDDFSDDDY